MVDVVTLLPSNEHDEAIFEAWQAGKSTRALAREFGMRQSEIEHVLDRMLPALDVPNQLRAFKRELERMEQLSGEFHKRAMKGDPEAAHVTLRANERICAMRGFNAQGKMDPVQVQLAGHRDREKSTAALERAMQHVMDQRSQSVTGPPEAGPGEPSAVGADK
jgi:hypothetical protein